MIYSAGTISINGSAATGTGTNWTAASGQLRAGQTLIILTTPVQLLQITAINSATSLTVSPAAAMPVTEQKYGILVTDSLSVDGLAQSISQLIKEYDENIGSWEAFASTTATQDITVTVNGKSISIPALGKLAEKGANGAVAIAGGGTGAKNAADARTNLGLGNAATRHAGTAAGNVMLVGAFGLGGRAVNLTEEQLGQAASGSQIFTSGGGGLWKQWGAGIKLNYGDSHNCQMLINGNDATLIGMVKVMSTNTIKFATHYSNQNTTRASDGTLKVASPVVKIFSDGSSELNDESEGCVVTRTGVGKYLISGCLGLNADPAWSGVNGGFDIPKDRNLQPLIWLDYEVHKDGAVHVKTYHRTYPDSPEFARNEIKGVQNGEPVDIPSDQFVSVRVEMPDDNAWKKNLKNRT